MSKKYIFTFTKTVKINKIFIPYKIIPNYIIGGGCELIKESNRNSISCRGEVLVLIVNVVL